MNILVLGGNGFVGSNLVDALLKTKNNVSVFDLNIPDEKKQGVTYYSGDFTNIQNYKNIFEDIDVVYHLISATTPDSKRENIEFDIQSNLISTIRLLNICTDMQVKKIIYSSSGGTVYGSENKIHKEDDKCSPLGAYAINKFAIERYLESFYRYYGLDYSVIRISNPYGKNHRNKRQGIINVILDNIKNNKEIEIWGDGLVKRDYIYIDDVISAFILLLTYSGESKVFNICTSKSISINELLKDIQEVTQKKLDIKYKENRKIDIPETNLDNQKAKECLGWIPEVDIKTGIKLLWDNL